MATWILIWSTILFNLEMDHKQTIKSIMQSQNNLPANFALIILEKTIKNANHERNKWLIFLFDYAI